MAVIVTLSYIARLFLEQTRYDTVPYDEVYSSKQQFRRIYTMKVKLPKYKKKKKKIMYKYKTLVT